MNIKLEGKEIDTFKSIISKVDKETKTPGFKNGQFNEDEQKLIKELNKK